MRTQHLQKNFIEYKNVFSEARVPVSDIPGANKNQEPYEPLQEVCAKKLVPSSST